MEVNGAGPALAGIVTFTGIGSIALLGPFSIFLSVSSYCSRDPIASSYIHNERYNQEVERVSKRPIPLRQENAKRDEKVVDPPGNKPRGDTQQDESESEWERVYRQTHW
jgi:hypothetical protein